MHKSHYQKKKGYPFLMLVLVYALCLTSSSSARDQLVEYKIKAGYLYNFTKFISWPDNHFETFNLCIVGKDPFHKIIDPIEKRTVKNKPIRLYRLHSLQKTGLCQIIYLGQDLSKRVDVFSRAHGILTITTQNPTLTVGESRLFSKRGGMISFFHKEGRIKLLINLVALKKSGLEISAKLLEVAEIYEGGPDD